MELVTTVAQDMITVYDTDGDFVAYAIIDGGDLRITSRRVEAEAADAADDCYNHGGTLPPRWQAPRVLLQTLVAAMCNAWHGRKVFAAPSDGRRMRVYCKAIARLGMPFTVEDDLLLSITI